MISFLLVFRVHCQRLIWLNLPLVPELEAITCVHFSDIFFEERISLHLHDLFELSDLLLF